jgi:hypothetical protein
LQKRILSNQNNTTLRFGFCTAIPSVLILSLDMSVKIGSLEEAPAYIMARPIDTQLSAIWVFRILYLHLILCA